MPAAVPQMMMCLIKLMVAVQQNATVEIGLVKSNKKTCQL